MAGCFRRSVVATSTNIEIQLEYRGPSWRTGAQDREMIWTRRAGFLNRWSRGRVVGSAQFEEIPPECDDQASTASTGLDHHRLCECPNTPHDKSKLNQRLPCGFLSLRSRCQARHAIVVHGQSLPSIESPKTFRGENCRYLGPPWRCDNYGWKGAGVRTESAYCDMKTHYG